MFNEFKLTLTFIFTSLTFWLGEFDGLLSVLIFFMLIDYITGVFCAIIEHNLSSSIGARGILQKILILMLVGIANALDCFIIKEEAPLLRTAVIFFYLSNEGISILENSVRLGLPVPDKLKNILEQIKNKN